MRKKDLKQQNDELREYNDALQTVCDTNARLSVLAIDSIAAVLDCCEGLRAEDEAQLNNAINTNTVMFCYNNGIDFDLGALEKMYEVAKTAYDKGETFDDPTYSMEYRLRQYFKDVEKIFKEEKEANGE